MLLLAWYMQNPYQNAKILFFSIFHVIFVSLWSDVHFA